MAVTDRLTPTHNELRLLPSIPVLSGFQVMHH